jgi:hypothetical protein
VLALGARSATANHAEIFCSSSSSVRSISQRPKSDPVNGLHVGEAMIDAIRKRLRPIASALLSASLLACGEEAVKPAMSTGAICPEGSTLTYRTFGKPFMDRYCTRCHASTLSGEARNGAPTMLNFDSVGVIRGYAQAIELVAAAGPNASNNRMPRDEPDPAEADRLKLGEWLACGAPP